MQKCGNAATKRARETALVAIMMPCRRFSALQSCISILILTEYSAWKTYAQDVVLEIIKPDTSHLFLCTNERVVYECRVLVGSTGLTWTLPTAGSDTLRFTVASEIGSSRSTDDGKFNATLTEKTEDSDPSTDDFLLTSTLHVLPPLDELNGSTLSCAGGTVANPAEQSTTISLSAVSEPTSPTNLRQDTSANTESSTVIQWSAPVFNGGNGMTIVSYAVSVNGQAESVNGGDSTYTITGLEYNTNYSVEVVAVNSCGLQSEPASITVYLEEKADESQSEDLWSMYGTVVIAAAVAVLISLPVGVVIGLCIGRCVWRRSNKVPDPLVKDNEAYDVIQTRNHQLL